MKYPTLPCIKLQDGKIFSVKSRIKKQSASLLTCFARVVDGRRAQGIRHPLVSILFLLLMGCMCGETTIAGIHDWGLVHQKWLRKYVSFPHGIPDERTIIRAIAQVDPASLSNAWTTCFSLLFDTDIYSIDGKTMRGVRGGIRHILSLFSHTHKLIAQLGVGEKENEIPAARRLFSMTPIAGKLVIADALHTQQETLSLIRSLDADYLVCVKGNQKALRSMLAQGFNRPIPTTLGKSGYSSDQYAYQIHEKHRDMKIVVTTIQDQILSGMLASDWKDVKTILKIHRYGFRHEHGKTTLIDETVYAISSRLLCSKEAASHIRNHWCIENNLHWEKDWLYREDQHKLKSGNAPQVMTFLRSMALSLWNEGRVKSLADTIRMSSIAPTLAQHYILNWI